MVYFAGEARVVARGVVTVGRQVRRERPRIQARRVKNALLADLVHVGQEMREQKGVVREAGAAGRWRGLCVQARLREGRLQTGGLGGGRGAELLLPLLDLLAQKQGVQKLVRCVALGTHGLNDVEAVLKLLDLGHVLLLSVLGILRLLNEAAELRYVVLRLARTVEPAD